VEAIAYFTREHAWVVVVKAADGDGVVEQYAMVGDVEDVGGDFPFFSEAVTGGDIERGVDRKIGALVRTLA
jgi:hypothetical protein